MYKNPQVVECSSPCECCVSFSAAPAKIYSFSVYLSEVIIKEERVGRQIIHPPRPGSRVKKLCDKFNEHKCGGLPRPQYSPQPAMVIQLYILVPQYDYAGYCYDASRENMCVAYSMVSSVRYTSLIWEEISIDSFHIAARALEVLNFTPLNNKSIRVMYSHRDPSIRKSGTANIFIKVIVSSFMLHDLRCLCQAARALEVLNFTPLNNKSIRVIIWIKQLITKLCTTLFQALATSSHARLQTDPNGQSKGYGFVQFDSDEAAQSAIDKLNGMLINDKQVYVGHFLRKQERETALHKTKFNNVYVKNLAESTTDDDLKKIFGEYGAITSSVVMRDADGKSKCFGFVNFENADDAAKAVEALNGKKFDDKECIDDETERTVYRVRHYHFIQGSGFVAFSTPEEASRALSEMNGKMVVSKPLYVALAQRKEERRARLQAQFSQMRPVAMPPSMAPRMPMYPPGAPGIGQQLFYGQAPPAIIPQQNSMLGVELGGARMTLSILHMDKRLATYYNYNLSGRLWLSAAACSWNASRRCSYAKFLCAPSPTGSAGPTSWWQARRRSCATKSAACAYDAAAS
ncbi:Polyadenylate-binding protein 2 [Sesamum angolense]|uniref:Polyadenylate-binding protein 2 n=1 Tax=Sesamum angolense TaxID=2727404 RepID=A0AAE1X7D8_9LAMI|nr:Polyadenylate-binding protein 2 [Sesamum angolense]